MAQAIDLDTARNVMSAAIALADDPTQPRDPTFLEWDKRIQDFSNLVKEVKYTTSIALVGAALIAKGTNRDIDALSLRASDTVPGAYNVRQPAENVLYPASLLHGFDIGSTSRNPLNGQTFNKLKRIDLQLKIRGKGQRLVKPLVELLHKVNLLADRPAAVQALAAYVRVRRTFKSHYKPTTGSAALSTVEQLVSAISTFVSQNSEGGGRAQSVVGGLFDALYGRDRVRVGKRNEPDRKLAGDVLLFGESYQALPRTLGKDEVREPSGALQPTLSAIEVRDKLVRLVDVLSIVEKLHRVAVRKGAIVAVAAGQELIPPLEFESQAALAGVSLRIFYHWLPLTSEIIFWSLKPEAQAISLAIECIRARIIDMGLSPETVLAWDAVTTTNG
jgi:hypothetical protein